MHLPPGPSLQTQTITPGGATFCDHVNTPQTMSTIATGNWSYVVLQGQSYEAFWQPSQFESCGLTLAQAVTNAGAEPVFFETWAREAGNSLYMSGIVGSTPAEMQAGLRSGYQNLATQSGGLFAPVGDAWETTLANSPTINLFAGDGSHPAIAGSYLTALVFYGVLSGKSPVGDTPPPAGVSPSDAAALQTEAKAALDSL